MPADIVDIRFTGSLANYNWSRYSDIDLHIVVDFSKIDDDADLVKAYFDSERMRWNDRHDIKINGFEVEIRGLGRWYTKKLKENYNARNPATNELIYKPERIKVRFKSSKKLNKIINQ